LDYNTWWTNRKVDKLNKDKIMIKIYIKITNYFTYLLTLTPIRLKSTVGPLINRPRIRPAYRTPPAAETKEQASVGAQVVVRCGARGVADVQRDLVAKRNTERLGRKPTRKTANKGKCC